MGQGSQKDKFIKIEKALKYQEQGLTYKIMSNEECKELIGYSKKTALYNAMIRNGYKYNKEQGIFETNKPETNRQIDLTDIVKDDYKCNKDVIQDNKDNDYSCNKPVTQDIKADDYSCNNTLIQAETDYKNIDITTRERFNKCLSSADNINKLIDLVENAEKIFDSMAANEKAKSEFKITIDRDAPVVAANFRMNKEIKDRFAKFCKDHSEYRVQEIISQALFEFLEIYSKR